jgi:hypothetical protein
MHANFVSTPSDTDSQWYHDTGSNVHLTNELSNLNLHAEDYTDNVQIRVGNGQGLHISHSGHGLPNYFCVKDLRTCQLLLQGSSKFGLYPWPSSLASSSSPFAAFIGKKFPWISGIFSLAIPHLL